MLSPARVFTGEGVDHHVAWAGIEGYDVFRRGGWRNHRDVGDPADVQRDAGPHGVAKKHVVDIGNQRRALSACRDIARAEVGDYWHARTLGNHRRLADLQRVATALMPDGLPVASNQLDRAELPNRA